MQHDTADRPLPAHTLPVIDVSAPVAGTSQRGLAAAIGQACRAHGFWAS